ncbi:MAG: cysteine desulfurase-like protein [Mycobacteriaceae bacterium]
MAYDVARVRGLFPSLGDGWIHLDAQAGMQIPDSVATTVSTAFRASVTAPTGLSPSAKRSAAIVEAARVAVADLVGGDPRGVVLGSDRAVLLGLLAESLSTRMGLGSEVVLSRLDDEANVAPWLWVADRYGAQVKWAEIDIETCELPTWQFAELIGRPTSIVALTAASAVVGSMSQISEVAKLTRSVGALLVVDAIGAAPYGALDIGELNADVLALNASSWGGPQVGALVFRDPSYLDRMTSLSLNPQAKGPERLELGGHQYAMLAGLVSSVEYLAGLDESASGTRRERILTSMRSLKNYHDGLLDHLLLSLRALPMVMVFGNSVHRVPTVSFTVSGVPAERVAQRLADNGICAIANPRDRIFQSLGVNDIGGAVTVGLGHYTTTHEVDQLVRVVASLG